MSNTERWECRCPDCGVDVARVPPCPVCGNRCCPCMHGEERADQRANPQWTDSGDQADALHERV